MFRTASLTRRHLLFAGAVFFVVTLSFWHYSTSIEHADLEVYQPTWSESLCAILAPSKKTSPKFLSQSTKRRHIAVASNFGFHFDVYMALVWTLERVLKGAEGTVQAYGNSPFHFNFQKVVEDLHLYHGEIRRPDELIHDITSTTGDGAIDMVILGTCEVDLRGDWHQQLLAAWDARDADHKFQLVCIVHHVMDKAWQPRIADWARRSAIRLLPISEHVGRGFRRTFNQLADNVDPFVRSAGYEYIPIDAHVPILDLQNLPEHIPDRVLSKAVIQGSFNTQRRDYNHLFSELNASLAGDPYSWGYLPLQIEPSELSTITSYNVDPKHPNPFHLYLIGSGSLEIPVELHNVVSLHTDLSYEEFYDLMSSMDICIPAFAENGYFEQQASSTFAMALECNVPILVTERMRLSYTYADDRVVITRPSAMREIAAIKALRINDASEFLESDPSGKGFRLSSNPHIRTAVKEMLDRGWTRSNNDFQSFKEGIWKANEEVVQRLLRDL